MVLPLLLLFLLFIDFFFFLDVGVRGVQGVRVVWRNNRAGVGGSLYVRIGFDPGHPGHPGHLHEIRN